MDSTPPGQQQNAEEATLDRLQSKDRYEQKYREYCIWRSKNGVRETTADVFISYLAERSKVVTPGTLWTEHSRLTTMINLREKIDLKRMIKVRRFMKQNVKPNLDSTPQGQQQNVDEGTLCRLPLKSKGRNEQEYIKYCTWRSKTGVGQTTEDVFMTYLAERRKVVSSGTLCTEYGMLKIMIKLREKINVSEMYKVKHFMKQNAKNYANCTTKKSRTLTDKQCMQFLKDAPDDIYLMMKIALIIGIHGACRNCEMTNLEVEHLTFCNDYLELTVPKTQNLSSRTFTVPNSRDFVPLAELVKKYIALRPAHTPHKRLFIHYRKGKCTSNPIGINMFAKIPANIAQYLNLPDVKLYTGHCFRRSSKVANVLAKSGHCNSSTVTNQVKGEKSDEKMEYEAQLPGSSTPSPSFQDIVLSPVTIESKEEEDDYCAENDERISLILDKKFSFLQEQLPLIIATGDYRVMKEIIKNDDVFRDATLRTKVHCTACDRHLGTSPIAQFDRFVHPVLNTLLCETCFVFYAKGEFPKDEDGSEIYCKWCAQGGTVMCCSDCPLVFCKDCVERNFGERVCEKIVNADIWQCFKCNPSQLSKLHIMCCAVHEYTSKIIENAMITGDKDILEKDISICCKKDSTTTNKRKHIVLDDELDLDDIPIGLRKRMKMCHDLNECLSTPGFTHADKKIDPLTGKRRKISLPASPQSPSLLAAISLPLRLHNKEIAQDQAPLKPGMPVITKVEGNVVLPTIPATNASNTSTENCTLNWALLKHALDKSQGIIDTFTRRCEYMRQAITVSTNEAQYAELRNSMQHVLHQCSNMLLESRKVVLMDEIHPCSNTNNKRVPARVLPADNKTAVTSVDGAGKSSTIILRNNETNAHTPALSGPNVPNQHNQIHPANTVRLVNRNEKNKSIAISQVGSKTVGYSVLSATESASKNNMVDKHAIGGNKTKTVDRDPLAMSDDESEGICIKTEKYSFIDESIMVKIEVDET